MSASADRSASSPITAAGFCSPSAAAAFRSSNCSRQRCSDVFDSAQISSVPTSVTRDSARIVWRYVVEIDANRRNENCVMKLFLLVGGKGHHVARAILGTRQRAVQPECDRLVGDQLQIPGVELNARTLFGAARG